MNKILKSLLQVGESVAVTAVPGAAAVDAGVKALIRHDSSGALDVASGAIQVIEGIKEVDIADEQMFRSGVAMLEQGFKLVHDSLKHKDGTPV